ncbi:hypothetical protein ACFE04_020895 [Oxalis oulophora]
MGWAIKAADEFGIPEIQFWTASACSFMRHYSIQSLVISGDNFTTDGSLDTPIDWIPGKPDIRLKDIPSFIQDAPAGVLSSFGVNQSQVPQHLHNRSTRIALKATTAEEPIHY